MASGLTVVVDAKELRAELRRIGDIGLKQELAAANKAAAEVVVAEALPNVPVRSGRLRASVRALGSQALGQVKAGSAAVPYAAAIEYGRKKGGLIIGRFFLTNATTNARDKVLKTYEHAVDRLLDKIR